MKNSFQGLRYMYLSGGIIVSSMCYFIKETNFTRSVNNQSQCLSYFVTVPLLWDKISNPRNFKERFILAQLQKSQSSSSQQQGGRAWAENNCSCHGGQEAEREARTRERRCILQLMPPVSCISGQTLFPNSKSATSLP